MDRRQHRIPAPVRLLRAARWVAILCEGEASSCVRDHRDGLSFSGEAVNHFGGCESVLCIFASDHQIAPIFAINPGQAFANARYETEFGHTIRRSHPCWSGRGAAGPSA
jgi:hypothetical protein